MGLDIRLPIGMMFSLLGTIMAIYGYVTGSNSDMYRSSLGINVNFWWGLALFGFGATMLLLGAIEKHSKRNVKTDTCASEGPMEQR